jgi:hypothetical protein
LNQFDYNNLILESQSYLELIILILIKRGFFPNTLTYKLSFNTIYNTRFCNNLANKFRGYNWGNNRLEPSINQFSSRNSLEVTANLFINRSSLENPVDKPFIFDNLFFLDINISSLVFNIKSGG